MTLLICPYCGQCRNKDMTEIKKICQEHGLTGEMCNPGGRRLFFGEKELQISDMCNACDEKDIREFIKRNL